MKKNIFFCVIGVIGGIIIENKFGIAKKATDKYMDLKTRVQEEIERQKAKMESGANETEEA